MRKILKKEFFERDTIYVAQNLLGKYIISKLGNKKRKLLITETEAYDGPNDMASHARKGRRTERTEVMFHDAGIFYIYLTYGMHWMLNIVTGKKDYPAAVLIRGGIYFDEKAKKEILINGPGKLTKFLSITKKQNGQKANYATKLWFESNDINLDKKQIKKEKRIGVKYAEKIWANKYYRFVLNKK